jgi:hypothetical protein
MLSGGDYGTPGTENDSCTDYVWGSTCVLAHLAVASDDIGDTGDTGDAGGDEESGIVAGDTSDASNDFEHSCGFTEETGPDDAYSFTADVAGCYSFGTTVTDWAPVIAAYTECGGAEIWCAETTYSIDYETWTYTYSSDLQIGLEAGETTTVVVDGRTMEYSDWGPYDLEIALVDPPSAPEAYEHIGSETGDAVVSGTTIGLAHDADHSCSATTGGTEILSWTAPSEGCYFFDLSESDYDTVMSVFSDGDACGVAEACNDDYSGLTSGAEVELAEGEMATILISGYGSGEGDYVLDINPCAE